MTNPEHKINALTYTIFMLHLCQS